MGSYISSYFYERPHVESNYQIELYYRPSIRIDSITLFYLYLTGRAYQIDGMIYLLGDDGKWHPVHSN